MKKDFLSIIIFGIFVLGIIITHTTFKLLWNNILWRLIRGGTWVRYIPNKESNYVLIRGYWVRFSNINGMHQYEQNPSFSSSATCIEEYKKNNPMNI